ncbi:MAG: carbohydrate kinase family protein [Clostridia bacterium]|nr:carbohydrate kinase family protein [Clostridia bacterium]
MGKVLVCGSIAYDNIMDFPGLFKEHILPEKVHALNLSFMANSLKRVRGGTAPNIAYNLALLGEKPVALGTAGKDFIEYKEWLIQNGIDTSYIRVFDDESTATCFITTDLSNNQITGFYPGAMVKDPEISLKELDMGDISLVAIAPTDPVAMTKWVKECQELGVPYLYDPGMQIPRLSGEDLHSGILGAEIVIFNEYEYSMMLEKTGLSKEEIINSVEILVETLGGRGSILRSRKDRVHVSAAKPVRVVDPTGAGAAYRAGLIKGYFENTSLEKVGKYASVAAVYAVEHTGSTSHKYTLEEFYERYNENFAD